ncbi:MAG: type IV pilus modification protein PilV [Pseudomonadota bacterium]|nr:MAG: type IV pilus modification protein PilV [Pseudomonadota bacterium]
MIEVLVTALVLSVGVLGLAALQGFSIQSGQAAYQQTQALNLAYEVADHVRANRSVFQSGGTLPAIARWQELVTQMLPNGNLAVNVVGAAADGVVSITVTWADDRIGDTPEAGESIVINTRI